jgi:hypothetical protein
MSKPVNYGLLDELIADPTLSHRQRAEIAGCSDWSARQRYRQLCGDDRPMKTRRNRRNGRADVSESQGRLPLTGAEQAIAWSVVALFVIGIVALGWYARRDDFPPYYPPGEPMQ